MTSVPLSQIRPDGVVSRLSITSIEMLSRHPDLFPLTIDQLNAEHQKTNSFTATVPTDATEDEIARFETHQKYLEDRRRAINIHLMRMHEDEEDKGRERSKQRKEKEKKWEEEKREREEREERVRQDREERIRDKPEEPEEQYKDVGRKSELELRRKKFYEEDVGELYRERKRAREAGEVGPEGRTVEEIDIDIGNQLLGYKDGGVSGMHTIVKGFEKPKGGGLSTSTMVEMGTQAETMWPDIVPVVDEPSIGTSETVTLQPELPLEIQAPPKEAISSLVKSEVVPPSANELA